MALAGSAYAADGAAAPARTSADKGVYAPVEPQYMPLAEIRRGMVGVGKTVVQGTEVEEFGVEVLGVLRGAVPSGDLVLIRVYGPVIERTGGIAAGMSGSPVYIEGRLAGAVAYAFELSDHTIGMMTPIERMLKIWETGGIGSLDMAPVAYLDAEAQVDGRPIKGVAMALGDSDLVQSIFGETGAAPDSLSRAGMLTMVSASTPVMVGGLGGRAFEMFKDRFSQAAERSGLKLVQSGAAGVEEAGELVPGGAIAVQLAVGDVDVSAVGTVTHIDHGRVLAFGHPFMQRGDTGFFMAPAYVHAVVKSLSMPFKLSSPGSPVGAIVQDRTDGIAGIIGLAPKAVPVNVTVRDRDTGRTKKAAVQAVHVPEVLNAVVPAAALNTVDGTLDRIGEGTAYVHFEIEIDGGRIKLVRDNMFADDADVAALSVSELADAISLILANAVEEPEISSVEVDVNVTRERKVAFVTDAYVDEQEVRPGQEVAVHVVMREFRGKEFTKTVTITIPEDAAPGELAITARGGSVTWGEEEADPVESRRTLYKDLEVAVSEFAKREHNSDLVVEIGYYDSAGAGDDGAREAYGSDHEPKGVGGGEAAEVQNRRLAQKDQGPGSDRTKAHGHGETLGSSSEMPKVVVPTDWVVDGSVDVVVNVVADEGHPEVQPEGEAYDDGTYGAEASYGEDSSASDYGADNYGEVPPQDVN